MTCIETARYVAKKKRGAWISRVADVVQRHNADCEREEDHACRACGGSSPIIWGDPDHVQAALDAALGSAG